MQVLGWDASRLQALRQGGSKFGHKQSPIQAPCHNASFILYFTGQGYFYEAHMLGCVEQQHSTTPGAYLCIYSVVQQLVECCLGEFGAEYYMVRRQATSAVEQELQPSLVAVIRKSGTHVL